MNNTLRYKGYVARVDLDADSMVFAGRLLGMAEPIEFHGASIEELVADFRFAVDHYLAECAKTGQPPERPASGKLLLRLPAETHAQAIVAAAAMGVSLNQWINATLARALASPPAG
ncbi:MAG: type II toxin-antitoxin system HicB family antitoxin [Betaproteobacteria bacterium]|nr:type II toxin-antitoxin system HicB family antitoxin [Betaproteobacteria bacterium]